MNDYNVNGFLEAYKLKIGCDKLLVPKPLTVSRVSSPTGGCVALL